MYGETQSSSSMLTLGNSAVPLFRPSLLLCVCTERMLIFLVPRQISPSLPPFKQLRNSVVSVFRKGVRAVRPDLV